MADNLGSRFPGVADGWARFDGPAGTQAVDVAIDAMATWLRSGDNANAHGSFAAADATDALVASARAAVGRLLGADPDGVVFGPSSTALIMRFTRAVGRDLGPGDEIVCTRLDHDANVTPWRAVAADAGATVRLAPFDPVTGRLSVDAVASLINDRTRWVAVTGASNAIGTIPDVPAIAAAAHAAGAKVLVDAVHLVPHRQVDVGQLGCDVLMTSPYKWYGPHAGVMWIEPELMERLDPYRVRPAPQRGPGRYEQGTNAFEAIAGTQAAAEFLLAEGMDRIAAYETDVFAPLVDGLAEMDHVTLYGPADMHERAPTVSFNVAGRHPDDVATYLAGRRIAVWSGDYYAVEVMESLGLADSGGAVRAGVVRYIGANDVARLVAAVGALGPG